METALVRLSMPGGVGGQRREPLPTRLEKASIIQKRRNCHCRSGLNRCVRRNYPQAKSGIIFKDLSPVPVH